jgi:hypothetical protein
MAGRTAMQTVAAGRQGKAWQILPNHRCEGRIVKATAGVEGEQGVGL